MYPLLAQLTRVLTMRRPAAQPGVARQLMESADAREGQDPQQAQELRAAAYAFLRVVR